MQQPLPNEISLEVFLIWEQQQDDRYEWIDGTVVPFAGGSDDNGAIITNITVFLGSAVAGGPCFVRGSDRSLVPQDAHGRNLGSFHSDLFVSCAAEDRIGSTAHFPTVVIEVLSPHGSGEFTTKKRAYLASRDIKEYLIIESTERFVTHFVWTSDRRLAMIEYDCGPVHIRSLGLVLALQQIYADTKTQTILRPISSQDQIIIE
jgi:Uma2 family endonuclease